MKLIEYLMCLNVLRRDLDNRGNVWDEKVIHKK